MSAGSELEQRVRLGRLFDFYGGLLTVRQQKCLEDHFLNDLSLGEIAEADGVSRQAVHDLLKRAELLLENYESKLQLLARADGKQQSIKQAKELLDSYLQQHEVTEGLVEVQRLLQEYVNEGR